MPTGRDSFRQVLIVGAGLTAAALAWSAARSARAPLLVACGRVGGRADSIASCVARGIGPPGAPSAWMDMADEDLRQGARCEARGWTLLQDALLSASRDTSFTMRPHTVTPPRDLDRGAVAQLHQRLASCGFGTELVGRELVNPHDAVVQPRRLALELLRQARFAGAELRFRSRPPTVVRATAEKVVVALDEGERSFDRVYWAAADPPSAATVRGGAARCVIIEERRAAGGTPVPGILGSFDGAVQLVPAPWYGADSLLVRVATDSDTGRSAWPSVPDEWSRFVGPARRRSLAVVAPAGAHPPGLGRVVNLAGLSVWPVAAQLGACDALFSNAVC